MRKSRFSKGHLLRPASLFLAFLLGISSCQNPESTPNEPEIREIGLGSSVSLESAVYGAEQWVLIHLPDGYEGGTQRYPVVYAIHSRFRHLAGTLADLSGTQMPPAILVYLETYDSGDLIPTPITSRPGSGEADKLVRFFAEELIPFIDERMGDHK